MIINGDGYGLLAAYIGRPAALGDWLGPKVGGHLAPFLQRVSIAKLCKALY